MVAMLAAGYLAPAVLGLVAALLLAAGHSVGLLWLLVALMAGLLLWVRNGYGFLVLLVGGAGVLLLTWSRTARSSPSRRTSSPGCCSSPRRGRCSSCSRAAAGAGGPRTRTSWPASPTCPRSSGPVVLLVANLAGLVVGVSMLRPRCRLSADKSGRGGSRPPARVDGRRIVVRARGQTVPTGKVKWFDADKGFGFLSQEDGP